MWIIEYLAESARLEYKDNYIFAQIKNEYDAPLILKQLMSLDIEFCEVNILKPTLEEIFMDKNRLMNQQEVFNWKFLSHYLK